MRAAPEGTQRKASLDALSERVARRRHSRRGGVAYQGAFEAVFAILISAGIGYWVDRRFDTAPLWLLVGIALGFGAFVLRLVRLWRQLEALVEEEEREARASEAPASHRVEPPPSEEAKDP